MKKRLGVWLVQLGTRLVEYGPPLHEKNRVTQVKRTTVVSMLHRQGTFKIPMQGKPGQVYVKTVSYVPDRTGLSGTLTISGWDKGTLMPRTWVRTPDQTTIFA